MKSTDFDAPAPGEVDSKEAELTSVFVYGTLMPGERWENVARRGGEYLAQKASLRGVMLADLRPEGYPALFEAPQSDQPVYGWLYTYAPQAWPQALPFLDELEGLHLSPPLYRRAQVTAETATGPRRAWVYLYDRAARQKAPGFEWVKSGRWIDAAERHLDGPRQTWDG